MVLIPLSIQNVHSPAGVVPLPTHLTSCTSTRSYLYLDRSLFLVPNFMSLFHHLDTLSPYTDLIIGDYQ
jgi:hypothetical protein